MKKKRDIEWKKERMTNEQKGKRIGEHNRLRKKGKKELAKKKD